MHETNIQPFCCSSHIMDLCRFFTPSDISNIAEVARQKRGQFARNAEPEGSNVVLAEYNTAKQPAFTITF